jgi:hypothetical protein
MKERRQEQSWLELRFLWRVVGVVFLLAVVIGIIMDWAFFFRSYDDTFAQLRATQLALAQEVYNETTSRILADMALAQTEAAINASLLMDIAMREAEQAHVNASLQADILVRETVDALIASRLAAEIAERMGNDTILQYAIDNATATLLFIEAFDLYSDQQFVIIENNITAITTQLETEIATRIAAQAAIAAAKLIIDTDLTLLVNALTAEVNARIAQDTLINLKLHLITTSLLYTIDGQSPIADNMVFNSLTSNLVIANGARSNQITLTQDSLLTLAGVGGDGAGNIAIVANNGLSLAFPSPHTIEIVYSGSVPPTPRNHARLVAVYPVGSTTCWIQLHWCRNLKNGAATCNADAGCVAGIGSQWMCSGGFPSSSTGNRCVNNDCTDESECNIKLGEPWHCRGGSCVQDWCTMDADCSDAFGTGWYCVNYLCLRAIPNSPFLPIYSDSYPNGDGVYQSISQPSTASEGCANCIFPQAGAFFNVIPNEGLLSGGTYPLVYGNRRPYDPIALGVVPAQECIFDTMWEGKDCGFIMPSTGGTYIVQITVNIRAGLDNPTVVYYPRMWFYMHIDRSGASPPQWEMVDSDYASMQNVCSGCALTQTYISMSVTLILSTAIPSSSGTTTLAPGTPVYAGWSAYWPFSEVGGDGRGSAEYATWYSITYDITQVA